MLDSFLLYLILKLDALRIAGFIVCLIIVACMAHVLWWFTENASPSYVRLELYEPPYIDDYIPDDDLIKKLITQFKRRMITLVIAAALTLFITLLIPSTKDGLILAAQSHPEQVMQLLNNTKSFSADWAEEVTRGIQKGLASKT